MPDQTANQLPAELQDKLQDGAAQIYMAALNSAKENGMDEQAATQVAWNTVKNDYREDANGVWRRKADDTPHSGKSVQSGGN
jgi:cation transport regulator